MSDPLFIINTEIEQYPKKYIWGTDKQAFLILTELINHRIYVDGFIGENEEAGMMLFHRPVISLDMIEDKNSTLILANQNLSIDYHVLTDIYILNKNLIDQNVIIYGAGNVGESLVPILNAGGITVDCFLDGGEKNGQKLLNIPIYSPDILSELDNSTTIIVAGRFWKEIEDTIKRNIPKPKILCASKLPFAAASMRIKVNDSTRLTLGKVCMLSESFPDKKLIMLGNKVELARSYKEVLECLGYEVSIMVTDDCVLCENVQLLDEVLYEENYILLLYESGSFRDVLKKIHELNLRDADWTSINAPQLIGHRAFMLDLNQGYTSETNFIPGIYLHGREEDAHVRIVTLGGSTTEEEIYQFRSWPRIMYESHLEELGGGIILYNGGVRGYVSIQELIKLIRDILYLKPDIVVVYSGYNDMSNRKINGFDLLYRLLEYGQDIVYERGALYQTVKEGIFLGVDSKDVIDSWVINMESMYAIAGMQNIRFHSFMQPMLVSQKISTKHGMALQKMVNAYYNADGIKNMCLFRQHGNEIESSHPYIHDLSGIFDEKDVYMDQCHVWEKGNKIIADSIWGIIKPEVEELLKYRGKK